MQDMRKWCCLLILTFLLSGCGMQTQESERLKDLDFTVMDLEKVPEELRDVLEEKKSMPFKVTYEDDGYLYICVGYGEQDTSGYSIAVEDLYLTDNAICVDTELLGPEIGENPPAETSWPVVIIRTELLEQPVIFQ